MISKNTYKQHKNNTDNLFEKSKYQREKFHKNKQCTWYQYFLIISAITIEFTKTVDENQKKIKYHTLFPLKFV